MSCQANKQPIHPQLFYVKQIFFSYRYIFIIPFYMYFFCNKKGVNSWIWFKGYEEEICSSVHTRSSDAISTVLGKKMSPVDDKQHKQIAFHLSYCIAFDESFEWDFRLVWMADLTISSFVEINTEKHAHTWIDRYLFIDQIICKSMTHIIWISRYPLLFLRVPLFSRLFIYFSWKKNKNRKTFLWLQTIHRINHL